MHLVKTEFESFEGRCKESEALKEHLAPVATTKEIGMLSQESASLRGPLARLKVRTLVLEEKLAASLRLRSGASLPSRIAVIGNYLPRQCGIATFTTDLCDAIGAEYGTAQLLAVPVNDPGSQYSYQAYGRWGIVCFSYS